MPSRKRGHFAEVEHLLLNLLLYLPVLNVRLILWLVY